MNIRNSRLQHCLDKLSDWAATNGIKLSTFKTVSMQLNFTENLSSMVLPFCCRGSIIPSFPLHRFFYCKVTFVPRIQQLEVT